MFSKGTTARQTWQFNSLWRLLDASYTVLKTNISIRKVVDTIIRSLGSILAGGKKKEIWPMQKTLLSMEIMKKKEETPTGVNGSKSLWLWQERINSDRKTESSREKEVILGPRGNQTLTNVETYQLGVKWMCFRTQLEGIKFKLLWKLQPFTAGAEINPGSLP